MRKLLIFLLVLALTGCTAAPVPTDTAETTVPETTLPETTVPETTIPETTVPETTVPPSTTVPTESVLEGYTAEEIWPYFEEVVLHIEYSDGDGDPSLVQKWLTPIRCCVFGEPTAEDLTVLENLFAELNAIPGFPGIGFAQENTSSNLSLNFLGPEEFTEQFSDVVQGEDAVGAVQFWYYTDTNEIYDARIGYRTDLEQGDRNSVLPEEIVNVLGLSDSVLREDSIIYQYSNANLSLSDMDLIILKLLYHPSIRPGMDAEECRAILEDLCR